MIYVAEKHRKQLQNFRKPDNELANDSALQVITLIIVRQYPGEPWDSKMRSHSPCTVLLSITRITKAAEHRFFDLNEVTYKCGN